MVIHIKYNTEAKTWSYYTTDKDGYKMTTEGFINHLDAKHHAEKVFKGIELTIKFL